MFYLAVLFLIGAVVTFAMAFSGGGTPLLYISILCSIIALALVAKTILRERPVVAGDGPTETTLEPRAETTPEQAPPTEEALPAKPAGPKRAGPKPAPQRTGPQVVALPERGTYHRTECRYVKDREGTERIARATAKRRGYAACGICKPG